ncbi:MAG: hypothetical protein CVU56_17650 [Deltaproteobacteria bacterium HGW-Deltaproteobacteria-14]|jgi:hypothetical protein|nr:MAG: hypothetical protein CVU56_17650 [Deltaproteobacteria bacterium HGW-Deltaproteobacteria-14]
MSTLARFALVLALTAPPASALAWSPSRRSEEAVRADFALAFGVPPENVVEAHYYELPGMAKQPGFILGRFREKADGEWIFPGIAAYFAKGEELYLARAWLGSAATKLHAIALVDLDAEETKVQIGRWRATDAPTKAKRRWPALVLAAERQGDEPTSVDLLIVSLRDEDAPEVLFERPLERRWRDVSDEEMRTNPRPAGMLIGHRLEAMRVEHEEKVYRVVLTERGVDSRWNPCLAPEPYETTFVLSDPPRRRFKEVTPALPPPLPCR